MQQLKSLFAGSFFGALVFFADPVFRFWLPVLFSFSVAIYLILKNLKIGSKTNLLNLFVFLFGFSFAYKLVLTRPLFHILNLYYPKSFLGFCLTLLFSIVLALFFSLAVSFFLFLFRKLIIKNIYFAALIIPLPFAVFDFLNQIYLNVSPAVLLGQQAQILSAFGIFNQEILVYVLVFFCTLIALTFLSNSKKEKMSLICAAVVIVLTVFSFGNYRKSDFESRISSWKPVSIIQTGQSLYYFPYFETPWKKISADLNSESSTPRLRLVVWPETTFDDNDFNKNKLSELFKEIKSNTNHFLGLVRIENGLTYNNVAHLSASGQRINSYQKNVLFPLGESDIVIPFLNMTVLKTDNKYALSSEKTSFKFEEVYFIPVICSELTQVDYTKNFVKSYDATENKYDPIVVNMAKDTFFERTSAMRYLSLLAQWTASYSGSVVIRSTTMEYSAVIAPWGEILSQSQKMGYDVLNTAYPVLKKR